MDNYKQKIIGKVSTNNKLVGEINTTNTIVAKITKPISTIPKYHGVYEVESLAHEDITLPTAGYEMLENLLVKRVSCLELPNEYGTTISISS